ncbi:MAG: hypothetical protein GY816_18330 [Cytophagales bacterium]|nr:hypothetical protein [Cytophagales bacterium]
MDSTKSLPKTTKKKGKDQPKPIETKPIAPIIPSPQVMPPPASIPRKKSDTKSDSTTKVTKTDPLKSESDLSDDTDGSTQDQTHSPATGQSKKVSRSNPYVWTNPAMQAKKEQKRAKKEARRLKKAMKGSETEKQELDEEVLKLSPQHKSVPVPSPVSSVPRKGEKPVVDETMLQCQESVRGEVDFPPSPTVINLEDDGEGPSTAVLVDPPEEAEGDQAMSTSFTNIQANLEDSSKMDKEDPTMDQT